MNVNNLLKEYLEFAKNIAYHAGKIMLEYFNDDNGAKYKVDQTIVTLADTKINEYLIAEVKKKFPTHSVNGEEESFGNSNYVWVCDPVDGTAMYASHIPVAVFSLALVVDGESQIGVVYDPFTDSLYSAIKGEGAYLNGTKISVNNLKLEDKASVSSCDMWPNAQYDMHKVIEELGKKTYLVSLGSSVRECMLVASGKFTVSIFPGTKGKNCDIAAAKVIVEEAGGKVTNLFNEEQRYDEDINGAVISNKKIHQEVIDVISKYNKKH